jgi:hypothetical protein
VRGQVDHGSEEGRGGRGEGKRRPQSSTQPAGGESSLCATSADARLCAPRCSPQADSLDGQIAPSAGHGPSASSAMHTQHSSACTAAPRVARRRLALHKRAPPNWPLGRAPATTLTCKSAGQE